MQFTDYRIETFQIIVLVYLPVVLDVVCCHGGVGDPVVDNSVYADCDGVSGQNLKKKIPNIFINDFNLNSCSLSLS